MDRNMHSWEDFQSVVISSHRGGDPERFRDEARGLGRVALLGQFLPNYKVMSARQTRHEKTRGGNRTVEQTSLGAIRHD